MVDIDIGTGAVTTGEGGWPATWNVIAKGNPANATGTIDTIEIYSADDLTDVKVGTFYGSGTSYSNRDYVTIGSVTSGSKQTFTEDSGSNTISIEVVEGDLIGIYWSSGFIEQETHSGVGFYYKSGDQFGAGEQTYTFIDGREISVYGTGEEAAVGFTRKIKIGGTFQDKPIKTKVAGTFEDKPIKIKVGGTFQDA